MSTPQPAQSVRPVLSICIPTYQRSAKLTVLLKSISHQDDPRVEVVVSDNGSSDGTAEMVHEFSFTRPLIWHQWEDNVGFDRNLMKVVSIANGEYCWLVGSDDALTPGAVSRVLHLIEAYKPSGILPSAKICDADLSPIPQTSTAKSIFFDNIPFREIIPRIGVYLGFFSLQIFKRSLWMQAASDEGWQKTANNWSQYYMMLKIAANFAVDGWLRDPTQVLLYRSSSFVDQIEAIGSVHRKILKDLVASMEAVAATVPPNMLNAFMTDLMQFEIRRDIFFWKNANPGWHEKAEMLSIGRRVLGKYHWWWFKLVPIILMPNSVLIVLRSIIRNGKAVLRNIRRK